jgi:hypothetical protein
MPLFSSFAGAFAYDWHIQWKAEERWGFVAGRFNREIDRRLRLGSRYGSQRSFAQGHPSKAPGGRPPLPKEPFPPFSKRLYQSARWLKQDAPSD